MKRQKKSPGCYIAWYANMPSQNGKKKSILVCIKGVEGWKQYDWSETEPRGPFYAAAKQYAIERGFDDVKETGVLNRGVGFIFEPVLYPRNKKEKNR